MRICLQGHRDNHNLSKCEVCGLATTLVCPDTLKSVKEPKENGIMISCDATPRCITQKHRWMYVAPAKEIEKDCKCPKPRVEVINPQHTELATCLDCGHSAYFQHNKWEHFTRQYRHSGFPYTTLECWAKVGSGSFHKKTNFMLDDISEIKEGEFEIFPFLHSE